MRPSASTRYAQLREACATRQSRLTPQRDVLLRVLGGTTGHPTADALVRRVRRVLPSVSHATVYRNVQALAAADSSAHSNGRAAPCGTR